MTETLSEADCLDIGISHLHRNEYGLANEFFDKALALNHESYEAYNQKGVLAMQMGDYEKATYCWKKSIELKENAPALSNLGFHLSKLENNQQARPYLKRAFELAPHETDSAVQWAYLEMLDKNYDTAEGVLQELIDAEIEGYPELISEQVYSMLSQVKSDKKDYQGAIDVMKGLLRKLPESLTAIHDLARLHRIIEAYPEANQYYGRLLEIIPNNADLIKEYGSFLNASNDLVASMKYLEEKVSLLENDIEMHLLMAFTYEKAGETRKALGSFNRAAQFNPTDIGLKMKIAELQKLISQS